MVARPEIAGDIEGGTVLEHPQESLTDRTDGAEGTNDRCRSHLVGFMTGSRLHVDSTIEEQGSVADQVLMLVAGVATSDLFHCHQHALSQGIHSPTSFLLSSSKSTFSHVCLTTVSGTCVMPPSYKL